MPMDPSHAFDADDPQRSLVYLCEATVADLGWAFATIEQAQRYLDLAIRHPYWRAKAESRSAGGRSPEPGSEVAPMAPAGERIRVLGGTRTPEMARALYLRDGRFVVELPLPERPGRESWGMVEQVLVHELAHVLVWLAGLGPDPGHGPMFATVYADLTFVLRGPDAASRLSAAFGDLGVAMVELAQNGASLISGREYRRPEGFSPDPPAVEPGLSRRVVEGFGHDPDDTSGLRVMTPSQARGSFHGSAAVEKMTR